MFSKDCRIIINEVYSNVDAVKCHIYFLPIKYFYLSSVDAMTSSFNICSNSKLS
nr:hypothetical protein Itr_chr05CG14720 [Ipomoea trifida]